MLPTSHFGEARGSHSGPSRARRYRRPQASRGPTATPVKAAWS